MKLTELMFSFQGRIGRGPYWLGTMLVWVYYAVAFMAFNGLGGVGAIFSRNGAPVGGAGEFAESTGFAVLLIGLAAIVWMDLAVQVKRWHDRNKPAHWVLISLIPGFGLCWAIIECGLFPAAPGRNRYGRTAGALHISTAAA